MDNAEKLAKRMLNSLNLNDEGVLASFLKGALDLSVSFGYLGYEVLDTGNRRENSNDHYRMAEIIKNGTSNKDSIKK